MTTKRYSIMAAIGLLLALTSSASIAAPPAQTMQVDPSEIIYTFFPVTLYQSFVGVSDAQAAKIRAVETKLDTEKAMAKDATEKKRMRQQASAEAKAVLLPAQIETLANCALGLQILTNTFGHRNLERLKLTPDQMPSARSILAKAVTQYTQINQERDQEMTALSAQTSAADEQKRIEQIQQEREQKIVAMRAAVKTGMEAIFTDTQKDALAAHAQ